MSLIIPDYNLIDYNHSCVLYKTYGKKCSKYILNEIIEEQILKFKNINSEKAIVHGVGFFVFMIGVQTGLINNVKELIVIDGFLPADGRIGIKEYNLNLPYCKTIYISTTVGNKSSYLLENRVTEMVLGSKRNDVKIVKANGFRKNLLFGNFTVESVDAMLEHVKIFYESENLVNNISFEQFN